MAPSMAEAAPDVNNLVSQTVTLLMGSPAVQHSTAPELGEWGVRAVVTTGSPVRGCTDVPRTACGMLSPTAEVGLAWTAGEDDDSLITNNGALANGACEVGAALLVRPSSALSGLLVEPSCGTPRMLSTQEFTALVKSPPGLRLESTHYTSSSSLSPFAASPAASGGADKDTATTAPPPPPSVSTKAPTKLKPLPAGGRVRIQVKARPSVNSRLGAAAGGSSALPAPVTALPNPSPPVPVACGEDEGRTEAPWPSSPPSSAQQHQQPTSSSGASAAAPVAPAGQHAMEESASIILPRMCVSRPPPSLRGASNAASSGGTLLAVTSLPVLSCSVPAPVVEVAKAASTSLPPAVGEVAPGLVRGPASLLRPQPAKRRRTASSSCARHH